MFVRQRDIETNGDSAGIVRAAALLLDHLNETETLYPGTDMMMRFELSGTDPPDAETPVKQFSQR